ncbi:hypothetical protein G6F57_001770 [Rhizopus arrhizus]|uniref:Pentacotripeptide-repeat region of PRORP domain-containing protein n=1 Tax=Rhizopus oryzae TaxID=64495 RepID=A0A9P6XHK7_RHIOR|nr:hypothetical protein G6F23_000498 [Rhizopus arrhizus]KAG1429207.1 hypothetical protein G6F58_000159 [Rhizopus delemar]KAG0768839.1 hypothetical protein G6F24_001592 [Rhizopus arrhizus]KAG0795721.1 hypothetical protein G6F21_001886 [Rhizopus arrhizus]KAG0817181.1 hypothetical protein G6F20_002595 [Rhizopus arrhizus]
MVRLQCRQLHSGVRQCIGHHLLQQPKSASLTHSCQTRSAAHLTTGTKKGESLEIIQSYLSEIDHSFLQQQKTASKKKIPIHITSKINSQVDSPILLSIHSYLSLGDTTKAWKLFDKSTLPLSQHSIPRSTAQLLLESLYSDVHTHHSRLALNFRKLESLYTSRLETLVGLVKEKHFWDTREFCMLIELCGKLNQVRRAESMFRNLPQHCQDGPSLDAYNELLAVYVRRFRWESDGVKKRYFSKMETLVQEMSRKGLPPNTTSYNLLLAAKIKLQDLQGAEKICLKMLTPNRTTYNILLNGFLKGCRTLADKHIANVWMERLIASGITPNMRTFKSIIDGLSEQVNYHARMNETEDMKAIVQSISDLHKTMIQLGHKLDTEMVNTLLKCYTAANDIDNIEEIMGMLALPEKKTGCGNCGCGKNTAAVQTDDDISQIKISPDTYTFNILIKYYLSNANTDQAFQIYDTMVSMKLDPDTVTYGSFILYYASRGEIEESLKYFDVMQKKGIPTNNYIYNILLASSIKYSEHAHLITPHLNSMLAAGATLDTVSQNTLLSKQAAHSRESLDTSFESFLDSLDQHFYTANDNGMNPAPTTRTYNTLLQASGRFYKANYEKYNMTLDSIIKSLDTSNIRPDIMTFALGVRNASYQGNMVKAESIYKSMIDAGIKPNTFIFSHLIYGYTLTGKLDKAQDILKSMSLPPYNMIPNAINYAPLIKAYVESAEYQKAHSLFREMLDKNITADLVIYTILAEAFLKYPSRDRGKRAIELLESIEKAGIPMDAASLTLLANAYGTDAASKMESAERYLGQESDLPKRLEGHTAKLNSIYNELKERQWLDSHAVFVLLSAHVRMKNLGAAWTLWNDCLPQKLLHRPHYDTLITGLSADKTWYPLAKMTFKDMIREERLRPVAYTFDTMIWSAHAMDDCETVEELWYSPFRRDSQSDKPFVLLVRTYYAVLDTMLKNNKIDAAKNVFEEYQTVSNSPDSSIFWNNKIVHLASRLGFKKETV